MNADRCTSVKVAVVKPLSVVVPTIPESAAAVTSASVGALVGALVGVSVGVLLGAILGESVGSDVAMHSVSPVLLRTHICAAVQLGIQPKVGAAVGEPVGINRHEKPCSVSKHSEPPGQGAPQ